jgi:hypothetical protein
VTRITINGYLVEGDVADLRAIIGLNGINHEVAETPIPITEPIEESVVFPPQIRKKRVPRKHAIPFQNLENVQFWLELFKENKVNPPHASTLVIEGFCINHSTTLRYGGLNNNGGCILCIRSRDNKQETV